MLTIGAIPVYFAPDTQARQMGALFDCAPDGPTRSVCDMKIKNSLKALKARHRNNRLVRRKGRVYIINKTAPRFKARQG